MSMARALVDIAVGNSNGDTLRINLESFDHDHVLAFATGLHQTHRVLKDVTLLGKILRTFPPPKSTNPLLVKGYERLAHSRGAFCDVVDLLANYGGLESFSIQCELSIDVRVHDFVDELARVAQKNTLETLKLQLHGYSFSVIPLTPAFFAALASSKALRVLVISDLRIDDGDGAELVRIVSELPHLECLDLSNNHLLSTGTATQLSAVMRESGVGNHIEEIHLNGCTISLTGASLMLAGLSSAIIGDGGMPSKIALHTLVLGHLHGSLHSADCDLFIKSAVAVSRLCVDLAIGVSMNHRTDYTDLKYIGMANERTRQLFESAPPLRNGQEAGGAGDFAELPNELICAIAERLYPDRSLVQMAWTCGLLRSCVNNYVAYLRTGILDWRIIYREALLAKIEKNASHNDETHHFVGLPSRREREMGPRHKRIRFTWQ